MIQTFLAIRASRIATALNNRDYYLRLLITETAVSEHE